MTQPVIYSTAANPAMWHELILGGCKSGKSRAAEQRARAWLAMGEQHSAALIATALGLDESMQARIRRHQLDRSAGFPELATIECSGDLAAAIRTHSNPRHLLIIDCLTLWLTQRLMPMVGAPAADLAEQIDALLVALEQAPGPLILVSNEIGLGVLPMDAASRNFLEQLGLLHQQLAARCARLSLMVAGHPLIIKAPE